MRDTNLAPRVVGFTEDGPLKSCRIEPQAYVAARLVGELSDAWKERSEGSGLASRTISASAGAIRSVGTYLTEKSDRFLTLSGDGADVVRRLYDWETAMVAAYKPPSSKAKYLGREIRNHVAYFLQAHELDSSVITAWAEGEVLDGRPPEVNPFDEFSNDERIQLETMCRNVVRRTEDRLKRGDQMLAQGRDPRSGSWGNLEDVVWALRHLPYQDGFHAHLWGKGRQLDPDDVDRRSGLIRHARRCKPPLASAAGAFLIPDRDYMLAVRILLHLQTGWSPEESLRLRRADIEFGAESVRVRAEKRRAQRVRWHNLDSREDSQWGWKAGDLLRRAAHAMRHAHALAPNESLFWTTVVSTARDRRPEEYPHFVVRPHHFNSSRSMTKLIEQHGLTISQPHDLRRLRKTVKSARAVLLGTLHGAAGGDHSVEVFRSHYAQTTTVHTIAAQTILRAQGKVLDRAVRGPTLVAADASAVVDTSADGSEISKLAAVVANETATERELTIAACRDPYDGPEANDGSLCHASPSLCLECRNAVIFRDHLPRLMAYRKVLDEIEANTAPDIFAELYGQQRVNIDAVIAQFPAELINAARHNAYLHRPLSQRAEQ